MNELERQREILELLVRGEREIELDEGDDLEDVLRDAEELLNQYDS